MHLSVFNLLSGSRHQIYIYVLILFRGYRHQMYISVVVGFTTNPVISVTITMNSMHGEVYSIQQCTIKFVSDLPQLDGFLWVLQIPKSIKNS
jgi:hypothetical protein